MGFSRENLGKLCRNMSLMARKSSLWAFDKTQTLALGVGLRKGHAKSPLTLFVCVYGLNKQPPTVGKYVTDC